MRISDIASATFNLVVGVIIGITGAAIFGGLTIYLILAIVHGIMIQHW